MLAPIALFVYNRLDKTIQTIEALKKNELAQDSMLWIFSDGPKKESDRENVASVREYIRTISGFSEVKIVEQEKNQGLARSIILGVTQVVNQYGKVIVLEDDIETSPFFLAYMNDALDLYESEEMVISIHGYMYPVQRAVPEYFFLRGADCWGWATWKRGWDLFEEDGQKLLKELREQKLNHKFDFNGSANYTQMLEDQIQGKSDSWAIRWNASAFVKGKYTLYPGKSLVVNIGLDGSGTHCIPTDEYTSALQSSRVNLQKIPVQESQEAYKAVVEFFKPEKKTIWSRLKKIVGIN